MFDAARNLDTITVDDIDDAVVDDPDAARVLPTPARLRKSTAPPTIAMPRVTTAELTMHVIVGGEWHRRTPNLKETACGLPIQGEFNRTRRETLTLSEGDLCSGCFTPHEIKRAVEADMAALEEADRKARKLDAEAAERRARRWTPSKQGDR